MNASILSQRISDSRPLQIALGIVLFLLLVVLLAVGIHAVMADNTVGMDLHIFYLAAQNVFLHHESPYGEDVAMQSQLSVFSRPAKDGEDHMGFPYPPYSLLLLAPLASLSFSWVQAIWMAFFLMSSVGAMLLVFPSRPLLPMVGVLLFFPFTFGIILGNFVNLIALVIIAAISQLLFARKPSQGTQILLGVLLAWATLKPQIIWIYLIILLLASLKKKFWPLLVSFAISFSVFIGISFLLLPNWPALWLERIDKYVDYMAHFPNITHYLNQLRPAADAQTLTVALIALMLGVTAWALFSWWKGRLSALVLLAWVGIVTYLIHPTNVSYAQITFLIPLMVWAQTQKNQHSWPIIIFYWGAMILSWVIFYLGHLGRLGPLVEEWRLIVGCLWVFWMLIWPSRHQIQPTVTSRPV
ncbi:MAG TPA: glycosyltransferase 87 family protein [Longilinea sp.]|nr:glycosyltransferase 87 family protein [Longilinea sp.]